MKKRWVWLVVFVVAAGVAGWKATHTETALEGLQGALAQSTEMWGIKQIIAEEPIAEDSRLFIYESTPGVVIVALMKEEKTFWSTDWKLLGAMGAGSAIKTPGSSLQVAKSAKGYEDYWITNGTLYNDKIETIKVGDQQAKIVGKPGETRVYYDVRPLTKDYDKNTGVKAYDKQGNVVEEMP